MKKFLLLILVLTVSASVFSFYAVNIGGDWKITMQSPRGERTNDMKIVQDGEKLTLTITSQRGDMTYEGTIKEADVTWSATREGMQGGTITITYTGKVEGETIKGTVQMGDFGSFDFSAVKAK